MKRPDAVAYVVARPRDRVPPGRGSVHRSRQTRHRTSRADLLETLTNATLAGLTPRIVRRGATEQQELRQLAGPLTQVSIQSGGRPCAQSRVWHPPRGVQVTVNPQLPVLDFRHIGPAVGSRFPNVLLPDQTGRMVDLHAERGGRPALVVVYRSARW